MLELICQHFRASISLTVATKS